MKNSAKQQQENILKLRRYLNYQLSGTVLYLLSFFALLFLFIAGGVAVAFSLFMLKVLIKEKKTGWIVFFILLVVLPILFFALISIWIPSMRPISLFSIGLFYLYFFLLRFEVNDWVREYNAKMQSELESARRKEELKIFMKKFE